MSSEQVNTESIVEEVKPMVVEETVPVIEETVAEPVAADERKSKTKSFFSIFKKDDEEKEEAVAEETTEPVAEAAAGEGEGEAPAATEEVPVETSPAKKGRLCGLCSLGKKSDEVEAPACTEEATDAPAEEATTDAPAEEATTDAPVPVEEAMAEAPVEDIGAAAAVCESTEGEAAAGVTEADVVRCGVLFKSGKFFKGHLNERHCRLLATGVFQWSKSEDFSKAHECKITAETTTVAFLAEGEDAAHKYRFEMHCCGAVVTYAADAEEDRDEWIRAIETIKESMVVPAATEVEAPATEEVTEPAAE